MRLISAVVSLLYLGACIPAEIELAGAKTASSKIQFYPGGNTLDDLVIIDGQNFFGKAQYQFDDPLGDIGFRFNDGRRIRAECIEVGKDLLGPVNTMFHR